MPTAGEMLEKFRSCGHAFFGNEKRIWAGVALLLTSGLWVHLHSYLNHDTAWYLIAARQFFAGGTLYGDFFVEVNPPLALTEVLPAIWLAVQTGWDEITVFTVYSYAIVLMSLLVTDHHLRADPDVSPVLRGGFLLVYAFGLVFYFAAEFGQREHFLVAFTIPYIALAARRTAGSAPCGAPLAVATGLLATLGFALKPHYLLVPALLELYRLARTRTFLSVFRPETLALGFGLALYLNGIVFLTPGYIETIVPYALETYNEAYRNPLPEILQRAKYLFFILAPVLHLASRRAQPCPVLTDVLLIAALGFFITYVVQMKGWYYHLYPSALCLLLSYATISLAFFERRQSVKSRIGAMICGISFLLAFEILTLLAVGHAGRGTYREEYVDAILPVVKKYADGGSMVVLGSNVWAGFPLTNYSNADWAMRFPTLWMLPGLVRRREAGEPSAGNRLGEIENYIRNAIIDDLSRHQPQVIIVDERAMKSYYNGISFDYIEFLAQESRFSTIWENYRPAPGINKVKGFGIYVRQ